MKLVAGLGNPGKEYEGTPHNVGFDVADLLAARLGVEWKSSTRFHALTAKTQFAGDALLLAKPQTYMNLSGTSIAPLLRYFGGTPADLVAVEDDSDLPFGSLRIRGSGSSGGHHGLDSIIASLGTDAFARVRLGMGRSAVHGNLASQVLGKFGAERRETVRRLEEAAADAVQAILEKGLEEAMNRFNGWSAEEAPAEAGIETRHS